MSLGRGQVGPGVARVGVRSAGGACGRRARARTAGLHSFNAASSARSSRFASCLPPGSVHRRRPSEDLTSPAVARLRTADSAVADGGRWRWVSPFCWQLRSAGSAGPGRLGPLSWCCCPVPRSPCGGSGGSGSRSSAKSCGRRRASAAAVHRGCGAVGREGRRELLGPERTLRVRRSAAMDLGHGAGRAQRPGRSHAVLADEHPTPAAAGRCARRGRGRAGRRRQRRVGPSARRTRGRSAPLVFAASWLRWCTRKHRAQRNSSACMGSTLTVSSSSARSAPGSSKLSATSASSTSTAAPTGSRRGVP